MRKLLINAGTAIALLAAPTVATAQKAAAPAKAEEVQPAAEEVDGGQIRGGFILPLLAVIGIVIAILLLTKDNDTNAVPLSP